MDTSSPKKWLKWAFVAGIIGFLDSAWLLILHLSEGKLSQACSVGSTISCQVLEFKNYSEWFSVPVPVFSVIFYGVVVAVARRALKSTGEQQFRPVLYLWLLSFPAILMTVYFAIVSLGILRMLCPYCTVLYLTSIGLFVSAWKAKASFPQTWGHILSYDLKQAPGSRWLWVPLVALAVLTGGVVWFSQRVGLSKEVSFLTDSGKRSLGPAVAPVVIQEFSDFECPHCRIGAEVMKNVLAQLKDQVRLVYKFYPLDQSCNPMGGMHKYACNAAKAAYCASVQDKFWPYHDLLFTSQNDLSDPKLYLFAEIAGLDLAPFRSCMASEGPMKEIQKDINEGTTAGVRGTPSLFINGKLYSGPLDVESIKYAILQNP